MNVMRPHDDAGSHFICGKEREGSMKFYDEQLRQLQNQIARKRQLEAKVSELRAQRSGLSERVRELKTILLSEQADVEKMEGRSLTAFFYHVMGKRDEQLNKSARRRMLQKSSMILLPVNWLWSKKIWLAPKQSCPVCAAANNSMCLSCRKRQPPSKRQAVPRRKRFCNWKREWPF